MKFLIAFILSLMPASGSLVRDFRYIHHPSFLTADSLITAIEVIGFVETELDSEKSPVIPGAMSNRSSTLKVLKTSPDNTRILATGDDRNKKIAIGWKDFKRKNVIDVRAVVRAHCAKESQEKRRTGKTEKYTCKSSNSGTRLRWS